MIAAPSAPVSLTRRLLLPARGVDGSEEYSSVGPCGAFMAAAAPTPGGGGANDPSAAWNWLSELIRKLAEVTIRSPASRPFNTTKSSPAGIDLDIPAQNNRRRYRRQSPRVPGT